MLQGSSETLRRARALRREMSLPELLLWRELRASPEGLKFRKQHPSGPFVADFFCHETRLIVEIDGEAHGLGDRPARDHARDAWFDERGIDVMRVPAREVLKNLEGVVMGIVARAKLPPRARGRR